MDDVSLADHHFEGLIHWVNADRLKVSGVTQRNLSRETPQRWVFIVERPANMSAQDWKDMWTNHIRTASAEVNFPVEFSPTNDPAKALIAETWSDVVIAESRPYVRP